MKKIASKLLLTFLIIPSAFAHLPLVLQANTACPDLTGVYSCRDPLGTVSVIEVTQEGNHFNLSGLSPIDDLVADGTNRRVPNGSLYRNGNYTANCQGDSIMAKVSGDVYQGGLFMGTAKVDVSLSLDSNQNLVSKVKGVLRGIFIQTPISETLNCPRRN